MGSGVGYTHKQARNAAIDCACRRTELHQICEYAQAQYQLMYSLHHPQEIVDHHYDYLSPILQRYRLTPPVVEARVEDCSLTSHRYYLRPDAYVDYPRVLAVYVHGDAALAFYVGCSICEARKGVKRRVGVSITHGLSLEHVVGQNVLLINDSQIKSFLVARKLYFRPIVPPPTPNDAGTSSSAKRVRDD